MKKKSRREPIVLPSSVEAAAKTNRGQAIAKKVTIGFASVVGAAALYYCLIPALAQDSGTGELYVFFDNGLSQYDGMTETVNGAEVKTVVYGEVYNKDEAGVVDDVVDKKLTMKLLADVQNDSDQTLWNAVYSQLGSSLENINVNNVYVSTEPVTVGSSVSFTGYDSGTVYDTVTNYRVNSASREWGYDYVDFQWTSDPTMLTEVSTCYYAPPQMMINRYAGEAATEKGGTKTMVQFIWEHGDKKGDSYSKPEATGAWVDPENANGRTFYDAEFIMEGAFGDVHGINELGYDSQSYYTEDESGNIGYETLEGSVALNGDGDNNLGSDTQQYPAKATFFDYFSDWELAGNPIEDHTISYTYNNADGTDTKPVWAMNVDYTATAPITAAFPTDDFGGFTNVADVGSLSVRTNAGYGYEDDGTYFLQIFDGAIAEYVLPADATGKYYSASVMARKASNGEGTIAVSLHYQLNGTEQTVIMDELSVKGWDTDGGVWAEVNSGSFYLPEGATNASLRYTVSDTFHLDNFELKYEGTGQTTVSYVTETATETAKFPAGDLGGFEKYSGDSNATVGVRTDGGYGYGDSSTYFMQIFGGAVAEYELPYATGNKITVSAQVMSGGDGGSIAATLYYKDKDGNEKSLLLAQSENLTGWSAWTQLTSQSTTISEEATDISVRFSCGNKTFRVDDFSITYEKYTTEYAQITSHGFGTDYDDEASIAQKYDFSTVDVQGDADASGYLKTENGTLLSWFHKPAIYTLPSDKVKAGNYKFSMNVTDTKYELRNVVVYLSIDGNIGTKIASLAYGKTANDAATGKWQTISGEFTVPQGATSVQLYFQTFDTWYTNYETDGGKDKFYTDSAYYDNFKLEYDTPKTTTSEAAGPVTSNVSSGKNTSDTIAKDYADFVGVNLENESSLVSDSIAKIYLYATPNGNKGVPLQGDNTYSNKETYIINGKVYSTDSVRVIARHYKSQTSQDVQVGEDQILGTYEPGAINISENFNPPIGAGSTLIFVEPVNSGSKVLIDYLNIGLDLIDIEGSFAEGTNTIAYSYQGNLFNDAISTYYDNATNKDGSEVPETIIPLYFGSNSWMTGNGRYFDADRHDQKLFSPAQIAAALAEKTEQANVVYTITHSDVSGLDILDDKSANPGSGAYIQPWVRQYWKDLYGFTAADDNYPHGFSNSRAVENLVWDAIVEGELGLAGTDMESPYFNEEFLRGENDANAAYGTVYDNVDFAFAYNEDTGYYEYDSTRAYYATRLTEKTDGGYYMDYYNYDQLVDHLDERNDEGQYVEVDENSPLMGVKKADTSYKDGNGTSQTTYQFYPFNSPDTNDRFATENLMFGMKLDIPFNMYTKQELRNNSMFKFSGDDDVWVYVDGKQVLDIGGTHTAVGGFIDLKNGYGIVGSSYSNNSGLASIDSASESVLHQEISTKGQSGTDQGITVAEKAAFALLASLEEIYFLDSELKDEDGNPKRIDSSELISYLQNHKIEEKNKAGETTTIYATPWTNGLGTIGDWNRTKTSVKFFDDTFVLNASTQQNGYIGFQYRARLADDGQLLIDVKARNIKADTTSTEADDNITDLDGETIVDWVDATFVMTQFELAESKEELSDHTLSVYYMERGLNSSNFKLAFNFVPNAQKQVEKLWADGNEAHKGHSTEKDFVDVELWRTEPTYSTVENADVSIPDGYSLVRAVSHNSKTDTGTANSAFIARSSDVTVQYELQDATVANSAVTLSLNSVPISLEAYRQLNSKLGMRISINGNLVSTGNGDTVVDDYEFFVPAADYVTADPTNGVGTATATDTSEEKYTAIKIPASTSNTIVKIEFMQKDAQAAICGNEATLFNTWGMFNCDAWLVDAYAFNTDDSAAVGIVSRSVSGSSSSESISSKTSGYTLTADEMQIAITRAVRKRSGYFMSDYFATATMPSDELKLTYTYDSARDLVVWSGKWTDPFTAVSYTMDSTYNGTSIDCAAGKDYTVKTNNSGNTNEVLMISVGCETDVSGSVGRGITYTATNDVANGITYSEPYKVGESAIRLNKSNDWAHLWDNVAESIPFGDETLDYKYFIREISASCSEHGEELSDYETLYYDAAENGKLIQPTVVTLPGDDPNTEAVETSYQAKLYSIDDTGYVQIVNNPITSAQIKKEWAVKDDSDKTDIVITLYGEDSNAVEADKGKVTIIDKYLLSADNNYTVDISSLPKYNPATGGEWKYYAAEDISAKYTASYSTTGEPKTVIETNETVTVYPLAEADGAPLTLTVTNQVDGFILEINKVDEDGTTPLEGAEFVLYEKDADGEWALVTKSAAEEASEETETVAAASDSDTDTNVVSQQMNVVGDSYTGNSSVSNFGAQQVLGDATTITSDVYYDASKEYDANDYAEYFTFDSTPGSGSYNSNHGTATYTSYNGTTYEINRAIKMGGSRTVSFTVDKAFVMTLVISAKYDDDATYDLSIIDSNGNKVSTNYLTSIDPNNTLTYLLPAGTYTIDRDKGESTLYFIDIHPVETPDVVSAGEYYNFSASSNDYSSRFDIKGNTNLTDISINYIDDEVYNLTKAMTMARTNTITFTTNSAMYLTIVSPPNVDDNDKLLVLGTDSSGKQILSHTLDDLHYDRTTTEKPSGWVHGTDVFSSEVISLPSAGTYSITCTSGSPYVSYLDFSTYNKYDAENFMDALDDADWFNNAESVTLANELVNLQITQSGATYDGTNTFNWGLMLDKNVGNGGWQKDPDHYQSGHWFHATIDNNVTTSHIQYLAKAYQCATDATKKEQYRKSVIAGIYCLINSQYENGGWGSVFENVTANGDDCPHDSYHCRITYNDGAMTHVMETLLDVRNNVDYLNGIVDSTLMKNAGASVRKGVKCILDSQIKIDGTLTVWCQQHYEADDTAGTYKALDPAPARAHELKALSASESAGIVDFLYSAYSDSQLSADGSDYTKADIAAAYNAAIAWYKKTYITGYTYNKKTADGVSPLVAGTSTDYLWARYYAIDGFPCDNYISSKDDTIEAFDSKSSSVLFDAVASTTPITIAPNEMIFVERTDTATEPGHYSYITPGDEDNAAGEKKEYITVYNGMNGLPEDQQKSYSWYGNWGTKFLTATALGDDSSGDSGDTGEETPTYSVITEDTVHNFTIDGLDSEFFNITLKEGSTIQSGGSTSYDSAMTNYIKFESSTKIAFTTEGESTLKLVIKYRDKQITTDAEGNVTSEKYGPGSINIDGVAYPVDDTTVANGDLLEVPLSSDEHTITLGSSQLYLYNIEVDYADSGDSGDSGETESTIPANAMIYITNAGGIVNIGGLQPGTYKLVEIKAPLGYKPLVNAVEFTVGANEDESINTSTISFTTDPADSSDVTMAWDTSNPDKLTLVAKIENELYAISMPNTGARGVYPVFIGSALFAAAAFASGMMRRRNKKR